MTDLLAIVGDAEGDGDLIQEIAWRRPHRVTVLVENGQTDWASDDSEPARALRERLATLLHAIEQRTGAAVVGLAGHADQLLGWRFDRVVRARAPAAV